MNQGTAIEFMINNFAGRPDLVFGARKKVIFVHGCFWHGHDCPVGARLPKTNTEFWEQKRLKNQVRDVLQLGQTSRVRVGSIGGLGV